jgi:hypothetical protein
LKEATYNKMTTYNTCRKKGFRCLFALVTVTTLLVPYLAFGAGQSFGRSGSFTASRRQPSFSHRFHRFGFVGGVGLDDQDVTIIQQFQPAPTPEPSEPAESRIYVPPHWVDGGYGVQVLQPGYWTVPKQAAEH